MGDDTSDRVRTWRPVYIGTTPANRLRLEVRGRGFFCTASVLTLAPKPHGRNAITKVGAGGANLIEWNRTTSQRERSPR